jgi:hypothetical protein
MTGHRPAPAAELLDLQHCVISRRQALEAGMSGHAIRVRVRNGRWQPLAAELYH